jgi:hypothetical protein
MSDSEETSGPKTTVGNGDDQTTVVPSIHPTQARPELAWSTDDNTEDMARRSWRQTWGISAAVVLGAGLLAGTFGAGWLLHHGPSTAAPLAPKSPAFAPTSTPAGPATPVAAPPPAAAPTPDPDDNQFVAVAFPPSNPQRGTFGMAGTEERARTIALTECKLHFSDENCIVAQSARYGCVSYAVDAAGNFGGGTGPDPDSARKSALAHLANATFVSAPECSK